MSDEGGIRDERAYARRLQRMPVPVAVPLTVFSVAVLLQLLLAWASGALSVSGARVGTGLLAVLSVLATALLSLSSVWLGAVLA